MKRISTYINVMSDEEVERIHRNSLRILAEIGLHVPNDEVLGMCREQGGEVNADKQVVRIPVKVMESLLEKVQEVCLTNTELYFVDGAGTPSTSVETAALSDEARELLQLREDVLYDAMYGEQYITAAMNEPVS